MRTRRMGDEMHAIRRLARHRAGWLLLVLALVGGKLAHAAEPGRQATKAAHALFDEYWEHTASDYPEWATWRGDRRFDARLTDASPAARAARDAMERDWLAQARAIDRNALSPVDRVSLDLFVHGRAQEVAYQAFDGYRTMSLGTQGGFHTELAELLQSMPADTAAQVQNLLARMAAVPRRVDQELGWLQQGIQLGWVPPRSVIERVLTQLDELMSLPLAQSPMLEPLGRMGSSIAATEQVNFRERGTQLLQTQVLPALQRLRDFLAGPYLTAAPAGGALSRYRDGPRVYAALIAEHTTLTLTARQLHDIGLGEVARLQRQIAQTMRDAGFSGSFEQWVTFLNSDPKFFHPNGEALLVGYRDIAKRIDPELPRLFAELPRAPYGIRALPAHRGANASATYDGPALDGSRPGWFNANVLAHAWLPTWGMETLVAHEAVPGHHLQAARAVELGSLPAFRRGAFFTAYIEGWGLYAETLGFDLGLYRDPYSRFGHQQLQTFRAARLVVDTGIHAFGWGREQAIDYLATTTGLKRDYCAAEVDRYVSWPGQALAYMSGQLKIIELRDRAKATLGEHFDIRRFHNVLLDQGPVPLPVLERIVDEWIAERAAAKPN